MLSQPMFSLRVKTRVNKNALKYAVYRLQNSKMFWAKASQWLK